MPDTVDNTELSMYVLCFFPIHNVFGTMIKFNIYISNSKILTIVTNNKVEQLL